MRNIEVLWGHHIDEYQDMFNLSPDDLSHRILEYGSGPSAINAQLHAAHGCVVSCDPWFDLNKSALSVKVETVFEEVAAGMLLRDKSADFSRYGSLEALIAYRQQGLAAFFADYDQGRIDKRYLPLRGDHLPFTEFEFDLALSAHYFFRSSNEHDVDLYLRRLRELARVAKEVRIFPIDQAGQLPPILGPVLLGLQQENYGVEICSSHYPTPHANHAILRVWAQQCHVGTA